MFGRGKNTHYFGMLSSVIDPDIKVMKSLGIHSQSHTTHVTCS